MCAIILLLMNSAQAAHICGLGEQFQLHHGSAVQLSGAPSSETFCGICASSHSPSLAASLVSIPSIAGPCAPLLSGPPIKASVSPTLSFYIRPPPSF